MAKLARRQKVELVDISQSFTALRKRYKAHSMTKEEFFRMMAGVEAELNKFIIEN